MHANFLLFLTLIFVVICTGYGYVHYVKHSDSSVIRAPLVSVPPRNGSTLEDITDMRSQIQQNGCTQAAVVGGTGGTAFTEQPDNCNAIVKTIRIRYRTSIDAIQMTYKLSNGQEYVGPFHGGTGGTLYTFNVNVDEGERIVGVFGEYGNLINQLIFHTSKGDIFGPFGGTGCIGGDFHVDTCEVRGILGRSGSKLDAIGFYCAK